MIKTKIGKLQVVLLVFLAIFGSTLKAQGPQIPTGLYTSNAWYFDHANPSFTFALALDTIIDKIDGSGISYIRIGGIGPNFVPQYTWNAGTKAVDTTQVQKLVHFINLFRSKGIEPIISVGFNPLCTTVSTLNTLWNESRANQAIIAGNVVNAVNNLLYPTNRVEYWIIGNEPDLPVNSPCYQGSGFGYGTTVAHADSIAAYFKDFAFRMKSADPNIKIIGPELATFSCDTGGIGNKIMRRLISDPSYPNSITGTISSGPASGAYYCDIFSFHQYLRNISNDTNVIASLTATNTLQNKISSSGSNFRGMVWS